MKALAALTVACLAVALEATQGPFTSDFMGFLTHRQMANADPNAADTVTRIIRPDLGEYGSFGGRLAMEELKHDPVVFVHGNSDIALRKPTSHMFQTGWGAVADGLVARGYSLAEMYATTYGDTNILTALQKAHYCEYLVPIRGLMDAVLAYTGAPKIDVVGHSMGVTLARKAIHGGVFTDSRGETCDLGPPLGSRIDTFVGMAGGNYGLCGCQMTMLGAACNKRDGFYPGTCGSNLVCQFPFTSCQQTGYAHVLEEMNTDGHKEADHVFSFMSNADEAVKDCWGQPTARIPREDGRKVYGSLTHIQIKDATVDDFYNAIVHHKV